MGAVCYECTNCGHYSNKLELDSNGNRRCSNCKCVECFIVDWDERNDFEKVGDIWIDKADLEESDCTEV